jgi:flavin reductase (DIM6/NTAB) family NADH-FMN oxidoreductase RutF
VPVTGDELRDAMRRFPAGVAVLTVVADGRRYGITVGSLASVSLEPPLVAVAIGVHSPVHTPLRDAGRFALSLLAGDQDGVAQHFARNAPPIALWEGVATRASELPEPLIEDALAWLECDIASEHPAGDHTLFVAEVRSVELGRSAPGLVYIGGGYRAA